MSKNLSSEFNADIRNKLIKSIDNNDLDAVRQILSLSNVDEIAIEDALFQAGYLGHVELANEIQEQCPEASFYKYIDGQFMAAVDEGNLSEMSNLIREGADAFQDSHTALNIALMVGHDSSVEFLINYGLDPTKAFSNSDIEDLKAFPKEMLCEKIFGRLLLSRQTSPSDSLRFGEAAQYDGQLVASSWRANIFKF